jgi:heme-degrading monooxygenase HmoA
MYARSTTVRADPASVEDGIGYVRDEVLPAVQKMDGCIGLSMLCDRDDGRCIVTTAWADEQRMRDSAEGVRYMRDRAAEVFGGAPEVQEWEIAVLHRRYETREGACARLIWSRADPDLVERTVDAYRMSLVPRLEEMPGFCSVSLMVSRAEGRAVSATVFESRQAVEDTRELSREMRDDFAMSMGVAITEVAEMDLVLAHLRVPETV